MRRYARRCRLSHFYAEVYTVHAVDVWLSGSALVSINEVTLRRARLLGWVTVVGRLSHSGQLSVAIPSWVGTMSSSERMGA